MAHETWLNIKPDNKKKILDKYGYLILGKQDVDLAMPLYTNTLTKEAVNLLLDKGYDLNVMLRLNDSEDLKRLIGSDLHKQVEQMSLNDQWANLEDFFCDTYRIGRIFELTKDYNATMNLIMQDFDDFMFEECAEGDDGYCLIMPQGGYWITPDGEERLIGSVGTTIQDKRKRDLLNSAMMGFENYQFSYLHYAGK